MNINMPPFFWHRTDFNLTLCPRQKSNFIQDISLIHLLIQWSHSSIFFLMYEMGWDLLVSHHKASPMFLHHFKDSVNINSYDQEEGLFPHSLLTAFPVSFGWMAWANSVITEKPSLQHAFLLFSSCFWFKPGLRLELQRKLFFWTQRQRQWLPSNKSHRNFFFFLKISSSHSDFCQFGSL